MKYELHNHRMNYLTTFAVDLSLGPLQSIVGESDKPIQIGPDQLPALVAYVLAAALVVIQLNRTFGPDHPVVGFLLGFWIVSQGILNCDPFVISLWKDAGFEIQFNRLIFLLFGGMLVFSATWMKPDGRGDRTLLYEYAFNIALIAFLGVLLWHLASSIFSVREILVLFSGWLTYLCFYQITKKSGDQGLARVILAAVLLVGLASSLVGIIQFLINPEFLKVGSIREAFSGRPRSNGVFRSEYSQSYFLIPSLIVALTAVRARIVRSVIVILILSGIFITFHRMSWIATIMTLFILSVFKAPSRIRTISAWALSLGAIVLLLALFGGERLYQSSDLVYQRLTSNTMSGRLDIFEVALNRIQTSWLVGIGSVKSNLYFLDMTQGGAKDFAAGEIGGIHNLYLNMAYLYGIPITLIYISFLLSMAFFFWRRAASQYLSYIAALVVTVFLSANLTNWFYPYADVSLLMAILAGLAASKWARGLTFDDHFSFFAPQE